MWQDQGPPGRRPVVVLSREAALLARRRSIVAACMTTFRGLPPDVELDPERDPVPRPCVVNLDAVESLSVTVLVDRLGRLADARLREICHAPADAVQCTR